MAKMDMFSAAPVTEVKETTKKSKKEQISLGKDLDVYAAAAAVVESLQSVQGVFESKLKNQMAKLFSHMGVEKNQRPGNFKGTGDTSSASCELRKRSTASALTSEEAEYLTGKGIQLEDKIITEEAFLFNPAILDNPLLRKKVSDALSKIDFGGMSPILHQEQVVKKVISEGSVDQVFQLAKNEEEAGQILPLCTTLALKPKFEGTLGDAVKLLESVGVAL